MDSQEVIGSSLSILFLRRTHLRYLHSAEKSYGIPWGVIRRDEYVRQGPGWKQDLLRGLGDFSEGTAYSSVGKTRGTGDG